jgi:hypothetical protein
MIYCLNCGKGIPDQSKFCTFCGTPVPVVDPEKPNVAEPQPTYRQPMNVNATAKNEFYKNVGFWGAVITLVGFFLPYENINYLSLYNLIIEYSRESTAMYLYLIFPVSAIILIIQALSGALPKFLIVIFKILPVLLLILVLAAIAIIGSSFLNKGYQLNNNDIGFALSSIGVGVYMTIVGIILMLFFRTTKVVSKTI